MSSDRGHAEPSKIIVVTGGSSGLGRGIAVAAARSGMRVVVGDLSDAVRPGNYDETPELTTSALIQSEGGEALFVRTDVSQASDANALVAAAVERFGRLDVLVNNAGIFRGARFHEIREEEFDAICNVVAKGSWLVSQAAIRQLLEQGWGGAIVNVVSAAGIRAARGYAAYNVAKAAQAQLTRCLALEYGPAGIRVNGVCPGPIPTGISGRPRPASAAPPARPPANPLGIGGRIKDVVDAAMYLISDEARFLTGVLIPIDGGDTLGGFRPAQSTMRSGGTA